MISYTYSTTKDFLSDIHHLTQAVRLQVDKVMDRMFEDPWSKELHPEKIFAAEPCIHSSRVNDSYRVIWKHIKPKDIVFCLVDQHDAAYRRAARKSFTLEDGILKICDLLEVGATTSAGHDDIFSGGISREKGVGALFIGYKDSEILSWGITKDVFPNIRALDDINQLDKIERLVPPEVFTKILEVALEIVDRPKVPDEKLSVSLAENQGGEDIYQFVNTEEFKRVLSGSLEDWMLFLAPPQRALVNRTYNGPARVKGVAGSGKTVVAIHRVKHLALKAIKQKSKILFLTYGNRLPEVNMRLLSDLVGDDSEILNTVECSTIHQWCSRFVRSTGKNMWVDAKKCKTKLQEAIAQEKKLVGLIPTILNKDISFFEDEFSYMIKGRDIRDEKAYLELDRSGRGTPLKVEERRLVWKVYEAYQKGMEEIRYFDYDDYVLAALDLVNSGGLEKPYMAVVVDEIQDLTEATMKLMRAIVKPGVDDLFLVGDGLQKIYPGGYSLNKLGIDITGRGTILRRNYRNTQQILQAAHAMIEKIQFDDMDDERSEVPIPEYSVRQGAVPEMRSFTTTEQELDWIVAEIKRLKSEKDYKDKDFALVYRSKPYNSLIENLVGKEIPVVEIGREADSYFGDGIKYSTFHSVKGLEFKVVFVVGVTDAIQVPKDDWTLKEDVLEEYLLRERRLLYVAMTRARDLLYLTCSRGQPSRFLENIPNQYLARIK